MPHFNKTEKAILQTMYQYARPMSMREISKESGISWSTVKKYVFKMEKKNLIKRVGSNWEFHEDILL